MKGTHRVRQERACGDRRLTGRIQTVLEGRDLRTLTEDVTMIRPPASVGKELRLARLGAFHAGLDAIRAAAEADAARKDCDHDRAARHETLAACYRALRDHYQQREQALDHAMAGRQEWEQATAGSRLLAIAADAELRR